MMNDALIYYVGTEKVSHRASREDAIAWLTGIYGPDHHAVGREDGREDDEDGREDDFGDMITADLPFVILGRTLSDEEIENDMSFRLEERLESAPTWDAAISAAEELLR